MIEHCVLHFVILQKIMLNTVTEKPNLPRSLESLVSVTVVVTGVVHTTPCNKLETCSSAGSQAELSLQSGLVVDPAPSTGELR